MFVKPGRHLKMHEKGHTTCLTGKMIILVLFPVFQFLASAPANANENYPIGSRAAAMGNASVATSDLWSVHHNQAGLAFLNSLQVGVHHENRFMVPEFGLQALALAVPARPGTIGLSYTYFGFSRYNESKLGLAFGRRFGEKLAAGVQVNYLHTYIAGDYGTAGNITVEGGFIAQPADGFYIGVHVYNPSRTSVKTYYNDPIPVIFKFGVAGHFDQKIIAVAEVEKEPDYSPVFKAGIEVGVHGPLFLRTGIKSDPVQASFGIGYIFGSLFADLAFTNHQQLGLTPHFSLGYIF
jgi:hypothetical protein